MTVSFERVEKRYGKHTALRQLSMHVPEGSAFALVGANGAGKTTSIKILMNLIEPTGGRVEVLGVDSRRLAPGQLARIGYVSENQRLPNAMRVGQFISYLRPFYPSWDLGLEGELIGRLNLPTERKIGALSHGMRVKTALLCALAHRPQLLVLDEPFSGLDPLMRDELIETLLYQACDATVLISSHELTEIETFVTHVAFVESGALHFQEPVQDLTSRLREVQVTLTWTPKAPLNTPLSWLESRMVGNVLSFVHTRFDEAALGNEVRAALGDVRDIVARPIGLRRMFTALARASQKQLAA